MAEATSFWVEAPGRGALRSEALARPGPGDVLVEAAASAVSRGTESLVFQGRVPEGLGEAMRCPFQAGSFPGPVKYGYASLGEVAEGPRALLGRRVFCLHPHQDRYVVPAAAVHPVPDDVPDGRAVLAANMETAVNGLWDAAPRLGDRIVVIGGGVVGMLVARLASAIPGTETILVDPLPAKRALAEALDLATAADVTGLEPADLVLHASGTETGLAAALEVAGFEATVVELSWYGDKPVAAPLGGGFHPKRLRILSSQVGHVATAQRARWDTRRRMELALRLLADPALDRLLEPPVSLADLPTVMPRLAADGGIMCQVVLYG